MPNYAPRVAIPYADASGVLKLWADSCQQFIVYEHEADDKVKKTHLHLLMIGSSVKEEAFKRLYYKHIKDERKGNDLWSWHHKKHPNPDLSFIQYMSKGKLRPVFAKGISPDIVEEYRLKWSEPTTSTSAVEKYDEYKEILKDLRERYTNGPITLDSVRSAVMSWYWHRDGRLPHAGQYKRNAASAYLQFVEWREAEAPNEASFYCALEHVKNLWY